MVSNKLKLGSYIAAHGLQDFFSGCFLTFSLIRFQVRPGREGYYKTQRGYMASEIIHL